MSASSKKSLKVVGSQPLDAYPISANDRLDSHYFLQWNLKRWRGSTFRKTVEPDVGWYGLQLFFIAQDETPIGTLPTAESELAFSVNMPLERWRALMGRDVTPLHGWYEVLCDNGEVRLAHDVVTEIAIEALGSKKRNAAKYADDRMRHRINTISQNLRANIPGGARIAKNEEMLNQLSDWIEAAYPGGSATSKRIKEAWETLSLTS